MVRLSSNMLQICNSCLYSMQLYLRLQKGISKNLFNKLCLITPNLDTGLSWLPMMRRHIHTSNLIHVESKESAQSINCDGLKKLTSVYGWGNAISGALGIQLSENIMYSTSIQKNPSIVPLRDGMQQNSSLKPLMVAAGHSFTVMACISPCGTQLYGCGLNSDQQIGYHDSSGQNMDLIMEASNMIDPSNSADTTLHQSDNVDIMSISCGRAHTWIATNQNCLLSFGNNTHGQCGVSRDTKSSSSVNYVPFDKQVKQVCCGLDHTIVLTNDGELYSCGLGADGQTGLGHYRAVNELTQVGGDVEGERIIQVSSCADCVLAVSEIGDVFGWGNSEYGQLSSVAGTETQVNTARYLPISIPNCNIIQVAASGTMCSLLDDSGGVHTWGYGLLGHQSKPMKCDMPEHIPDAAFTTETSGSGNKITKLECGLNHFAVITDLGELYMWGKNKNGCLGVGDSLMDQCAPNKVELPGRVNQVACGVDHTVVICDDLSS